jgi:hypothetical protein
MCLICIDLARGYMTTKEARRAYNETVQTIDPEHREEVVQLINDNETAAAKELTSARG